MASTDVVTAWTVNQDDSVTVRWEDGSTQTFTSIEDIRQNIAPLDSRENARLFLLAYFLAVSDNGDNPNLVVGKRVTFNLDSPDAVVVA